LANVGVFIFGLIPIFRNIMKAEVANHSNKGNKQKEKNETRKMLFFSGIWLPKILEIRID